MGMDTTTTMVTLTLTRTVMDTTTVLQATALVPGMCTVPAAATTTGTSTNTTTTTTTDAIPLRMPATRTHQALRRRSRTVRLATSMARTAVTANTTETATTPHRPRSRCSSTRAVPPVPEAAPPSAVASAGTPGLLQLIWLASPALPVGGFSYSEGLEAAIDAGCVATEADVAGWLHDQLWVSLARADLAVVSQAVGAVRAGDTARLRALDDWVRITRETSELRLQAEQMGRSLADWLRGLHPADAALFDGWQPTYPVAFAAAAARTAAQPADIGCAFAFGWAENMVQAAIKAVPLGQSAGQRILARLAEAIPAAVADAATRPDDGRQALNPMLAILSARHETQYSRLFRS